MGATAAVLYGLKTVNDFVGDRNQANAAQRQGAYEASVDRQNAALDDQQSADTLKRGQIEEGTRRTQAAQDIGSLRAQQGASGVDVGAGSSLDAQATTAGLGELDALMIRNNAAREAWGYDVQAVQDRQAARMAELTGKTTGAALRRQSVSTLLTGGLNTYGMFSRTQADKKDQRRSENKS